MRMPQGLALTEMLLNLAQCPWQALAPQSPALPTIKAASSDINSVS